MSLLSSSDAILTSTGPSSSNSSGNTDPATTMDQVDVNNEEDDDSDDTTAAAANTRAGLELGLKLFGTSQLYNDEIAREFDVRLIKLESELLELRSGLNALPPLDVPHEDDTYHHHHHDGTTDEGEEDDNGKYHPRLSSYDDDVKSLQSRISFLQKCAKACTLLEDVDDWMPRINLDYASPTDIVDNGNDRFGGYLESPSSICSAADFARFAFPINDNDKESSTKESYMIRAARAIREAERILDEADAVMLSTTRGSNIRTDVDDNDDYGDKNEEDTVRMLSELRFRSRRHRMELRHRANTMIGECIAVERIEEDGGSSGGVLSVRGGSGDGDVVDGGPLSDAYLVLELFSSSDYQNVPAFGETLDGAMRSLSRKLHDVILTSLEYLIGTTEEEGRGGEKMELWHYKFTQESVTCFRSSTKCDRRMYDRASMKGPAVRLTWSLVRCPWVVDSGRRGNNVDEHMTELKRNLECLIGMDDGARSSVSSIATSDVIDEGALRALATEISPSGARFISALNFVSTIITFVHQHSLLSRPDLASFLGKHLFGTHPLPNVSIDSGSVVLSGGILVGAAAHGIENGDEMPLMTELVKYMRRCCIPKVRSPEVWKTLQKIERCLVMEVSAFEDKMVSMGLMKDSSMSDGGTIGAAELPIGLSIFVNDNGVDDTAIHPTPTSNQPKILSPLSELVVSFRQAYIEGQRSQVLIRGRSILLDTDYHNTVQVGIEVPELSEPGTLASLDDDPMKIFAFHRCSISTTAQRIMDLCRETLDDATNPNVIASDLVDDALSPILYRSSRELLDLFRSIVPTLHAREIGSIPRVAAVLHNDCVYLAHESGLLGAEYKVKFRNLTLDESSDHKRKTRLLGEICSFLDMVPPFRDLATKAMGSMIEIQKGQLYELVSPRVSSFREALASNESVSEWDDADTALRAALFHLRHLSQSWTHVLARDVYHMSMGNLVDMVLVLFLDPVLKSEAITEAASRFVHSLFFDVVRGAAEFFLVGGGVQSEISSTDDMQERRFQVSKKYSTLFDKTNAVGRFMVMRLDEIQCGLEEGAFRSVTARELSHLITAAFEDSSKRSVLLNELASR